MKQIILDLEFFTNYYQRLDFSLPNTWIGCNYMILAIQEHALIVLRDKNRKQWNVFIEMIQLDKRIAQPLRDYFVSFLTVVRNEFKNEQN